MTTQELVEQTKNHPAIVRAFAVKEPGSGVDRPKAIRAAIPTVLNRILTYGDWDFAYRTEEIDSVQDQADYTLTSEKARSIYSIKYDTRARLLKRRSVDWIDDLQTRYILRSVTYWSREGLDNSQHPKFTLYSAPASDGVTITCRYLRRGVSIGYIPEEYGYVLVDGIKAEFTQSREARFMKSLGAMAADHIRGDGSSDPMRLDPYIVEANNEKARQDGSYGGRGGVPWYGDDSSS